MGSTKKDLMRLPASIIDVFGFALYQAQVGRRHDQTKIMRGYTVRYSDAVYVLHVFQKKSKSGTSTPKADMDLVEERLKQATTLAHRRKG